MVVCSARVRIINTECPLFGGKNTLKKRFGTKDGVRCPEFRGGRFSEVANVLQLWDFQSVTRTLSALGSVSASRSVRSGRFYCNMKYRNMICIVCMYYNFSHYKLSMILHIIITKIECQNCFCYSIDY